jgi:hypothetical protein
MNLPESAGADDTTAGQDHDAGGGKTMAAPMQKAVSGSPAGDPDTISKKGGPKAALFVN